MKKIDKRNLYNQVRAIWAPKHSEYIYFEPELCERCFEIERIMKLIIAGQIKILPSKKSGNVKKNG
jgi:hypothetical protein